MILLKNSQKSQLCCQRLDITEHNLCPHLTARSFWTWGVSLCSEEQLNTGLHEQEDNPQAKGGGLSLLLSAGETTSVAEERHWHNWSNSSTETPRWSAGWSTPCTRDTEGASLPDFEMTKVRGGHIAIYTSLEGGYRADGASLFSETYSDKSRGDTSWNMRLSDFLWIRKFYFLLFSN